jgi:hypothetical protein
MNSGDFVMRVSFVHSLGSIALAYAVVACHERPEHTERARNASRTPSAVPSIALVAPKRVETLGDEPALVSGEVPVAEFIARELAMAPANRVTLVSVGASWCEPCQRFHRALDAGELDVELRRFRFIEYDFDVAREGLIAAGYHPKFLPLFALPKSDGTASGRRIEGSIKGDGAVANLTPRLLELTAQR